MPVDKVNYSRMDAEFSDSMMIYQSVQNSSISYLFNDFAIDLEIPFPNMQSIQGYHPGAPSSLF